MGDTYPANIQPDRPNVLLVDDNAGNLLALEAVLERSDFNLLKARSGKEAIKIVEETEIALILLDIQMPEMDGFETARRIKAIEAGKEVPIVFITAIYREDPFIKKGYEAGGIDYFGKPFDPDILKAKVSIYANLYQKTKLVRKHEMRLDLVENFLRSDRSLLENLPVGVLIADAEGSIYQGNEESQKIWGTVKPVSIDRYDEYQGWLVESGQKLQAKDWPMARAFFSGRTCHNILINILSFAGERKTILNSASPLRGQGGQTVGVLGVIQDITHQRFIEESLMKRYPDATKVQ